MSHTASESVSVRLGDRSYEVIIGAGVLGSLGEELKKLALGTSCAVITDSNVEKFYGEKVLKSLADAGFKAKLYTVPAGEQSKSFEQVKQICDGMITAGLDRKAFVVALGGGVIGDLAGFAASIYYRGIPFVQVPTTIVALVDSSVGGKTGVNAPGGKNLIGCFHQPRLVLADVKTLDTLPEREFNEGFAEVIKHAIIRDAALFEQIGHLDRANLTPLIKRNVEIKAEIVAEDEYETTGKRALLNFGHTIGHGIEAAAGYGRFLHGEAISLGMVAAGRISMRHAGLPREDFQRIVALLQQFHLPVTLPQEVSTNEILAALKTDKKFSEGKIRFVLTPKIGDAFVSDKVTMQEIEAAIEELRSI